MYTHCHRCTYQYQYSHKSQYLTSWPLLIICCPYLVNIHSISFLYQSTFLVTDFFFRLICISFPFTSYRNRNPFTVVKEYSLLPHCVNLLTELSMIYSCSDQYFSCFHQCNAKLFWDLPQRNTGAVRYSKSICLYDTILKLLRYSVLIILWFLFYSSPFRVNPTILYWYSQSVPVPSYP